MAGKLERPAAISLSGMVGLGDGAALDGLFRPGAQGAASRGAVVAPPHPQYGGSMASPVVSEIAYALDAAGFATLRFDWRGVGGSAGSVSGDFEVADEDYAAALNFLTDSVEGPVFACGYSYGAAAAVRAATRAPGAPHPSGSPAPRSEAPRIQSLVLVAPPPALLDADALRAFAGKVFIGVGEQDDLAPLAEIEALVDGLADVQLLAIPETDHFFMRGLGDLSRGLQRWLPGGARD